MSNNIELAKSRLRDEIAKIQTSLENMSKVSISINEEDFPRVYNLRGIIMNLKSIFYETDKGIASDFIDLGYFSEKLESLQSDIEGYCRAYRVMIDGKYRREQN